MATPLVDDTSAEYVRVKLAFLERQKRTFHMTLDELIAQVSSITKTWLDMKKKSLNSFKEMSSTLESTIIFMAHQVWESTPDPEMIESILAKVTDAADHDKTSLAPASSQQVTAAQGQIVPPHPAPVREPEMVSELESLFKFEAGHYPYLKRLMVDTVDKNRASGRREPFHEVVDKVLGELYTNKDEPSSSKEKRREPARESPSKTREAKQQPQVCSHETLFESFKIQLSQLESQMDTLLKNQSILESQLAQVLVLDNKFTERLSKQDDRLSRQDNRLARQDKRLSRQDNRLQQIMGSLPSEPTSQTTEATEQPQVCSHESIFESFKIQQAELETQINMLLKNQPLVENQLAEVLDLDNKFTERLLRQDDRLQQFMDSLSSHGLGAEDIAKKLSICFKELDVVKKNVSKSHEIQKKHVTALETKVKGIQETQGQETEQLKSLSEKISAGEKQIATILGDFSSFEKKQLGRLSEFDTMIKSLSSKQAKVEKSVESILPIQTKLETEMSKLEGTKKEMERFGKKQQEAVKKLDSLTKSDLDNQKILRELSNELAICKSQIDSLLGRGAPGNVLDLAEKVSRQQRQLQQQEQTTAAGLSRLAEQYAICEYSLRELCAKVDVVKKTTDTVSETNLSGFNKFSLRLAQAEQMIRTVKSGLEKKVQKLEQTQGNVCEAVEDHHQRMEAYAVTLDSQSVVNQDFKSCIQGILEKSEKLDFRLQALIEEHDVKSSLVDRLKAIINSQVDRLESIEGLINRYRARLEALSQPATGEQKVPDSSVSSPECLKSLDESAPTSDTDIIQHEKKDETTQLKEADAVQPDAEDEDIKGTDSQEGDSAKGDSEKLDVKQGDGAKGDSDIKGTDSQEGDSAKGDSEKLDVKEGDGAKGDSEKLDVKEGDGAKGDSEKLDVKEGDELSSAVVSEKLDLNEGDELSSAAVSEKLDLNEGDELSSAAVSEKLDLNDGDELSSAAVSEKLDLNEGDELSSAADSEKLDLNEGYELSSAADSEKLDLNEGDELSSAAVSVSGQPESKMGDS